MKKQWRKINEENVEEFSKNVSKEFLERRQVGIKKYGKEFQGDPLLHQREEILDALFYNWASLKEREWLLEKLEKSKKILEEISEELLNFKNYYGFPNTFVSDEKLSEKILTFLKEIKNDD